MAENQCDSNSIAAQVGSKIIVTNWESNHVFSQVYCFWSRNGKPRAPAQTAPKTVNASPLMSGPVIFSLAPRHKEAPVGTLTEINLELSACFPALAQIAG
jgi:hypothetical protein